MVEDPDVTSLSVVLITRNGMPRLVDQLDAVLSQTWSGTWELVVVDNDSDDATAQTLATMAAQEPEFGSLMLDSDAPLRMHGTRALSMHAALTWPSLTTTTWSVWGGYKTWQCRYRSTSTWRLKSIYIY